MTLHNGLPSFLRFEEGKVVFGGVEEVLSEDGRADGVAENVEVFFPVTVAVGGISVRRRLSGRLAAAAS